MKRILAAALAILLGSTGYVIVDHTLEDRVTVLEQQVQSMSCDISLINAESQEKPAPAKALFHMKLPQFDTYEDMINLYAVKSSEPKEKSYQQSVFPNDTETPLTIYASTGEKYGFSIYLNNALYCSFDVENQDDVIYVSNIKYFTVELQDLTTTTTTLSDVVIK